LGDGSAVFEEQSGQVVALFFESNLEGRGERGLRPSASLEEFCDYTVESGFCGGR
jgi:hypothetical protein